MSQVIFQAQSIIIVLIMFYAVSLVIRSPKNRYKHSKLMKLVIVWDIILILQIEFNRGAIAKASNYQENTNLLNFHVSIAVATVLLYFVSAYLGNKIMKHKREDLVTRHKILGRIAVILRLTTLVTSFFVL
jgi:uncharacterized membrane protein YozB (DUF420 family)